MKVKIYNNDSEIYLSINVAGENRTFRDDNMDLEITLKKEKKKSD